MPHILQYHTGQTDVRTSSNPCGITESNVKLQSETESEKQHKKAQCRAYQPVPTRTPAH